MKSLFRRHILRRLFLVSSFCLGLASVVNEKKHVIMIRKENSSLPLSMKDGAIFLKILSVHNFDLLDNDYDILLEANM